MTPQSLNSDELGSNAMLLQDKVILITGSTTGVGEAIARRSVAAGARVMIHGLEEELAKQVCHDLGDAASYVIADLSDVSACERLIEATVQRFGAIHGLVNNAANLGRSNLDTTTPDFFDKMMAVNVRAPLFLIQAAMPHFRAQGGGVVLNIGSINALSGEPNLLAYSVAKGGLQTLTRNLANAHGVEKVRINQLNLSWVTTPNEIALKIREGLPPGWENNVPTVYAPFGKLFTPEQVANHAVFWLSDASYPANGVVFVLDQSSPYGRNPQKDFS
ncbi:MAG: SDR family oxidoreductase [Caldilineaceae bacterium]|nr:SDR family oxidoreductase [Caldilineaceae bacterium]